MTALDWSFHFGNHITTPLSLSSTASCRIHRRNIKTIFTFIIENRPQAKIAFEMESPQPISHSAIFCLSNSNLQCIDVIYYYWCFFPLRI